jgi:hypothetical protein
VQLRHCECEQAKATAQLYAKAVPASKNAKTLDFIHHVIIAGARRCTKFHTLQKKVADKASLAILATNR